MVLPAGFPSFPCPACGGALPATMPAGLVIPCPLCRRQITVPTGAGPTAQQAQQYQEWMQVHGERAAAHSAAQAPGAANSLFAATSHPVWVEDGAGGLLAIGAQLLGQRGFYVRAVDARTSSIRWEALHDAPFTTSPEPRSVCARSGRIYVAHEQRLAALDGPSGRVLWQARLSARIGCDVDGAAVVGDEADLREVSSVVVVATEDDTLTAFDRETGAVLWRRAAKGAPHSDESILIVKETAVQFALVRARDGAAQRLAARNAVPAAGGVLMAVENRGAEQDQDGVAFLDGPTGTERWFVPVEWVDFDPGVAFVAGELLVPVQSNSGHVLLPLGPSGPAPKKGFLARLFGGNPATRALPWPKHLLESIWALGDTLLVDARSTEGEGERRVALLDPRTLAVRYDSGIIPDGVAPGVRLGANLLAYAFGESNGPKTLRMVDPANGSQLWERTFHDLDEVAFRAGALALRTDEAPLELLELTTGRTIARISGATSIG